MCEWPQGPKRRAKVLLVFRALQFASVFSALLVPASLSLGDSPHFVAKPPANAGARVTARKANTNGRVLIVMYHNFGPRENRYTRSYDDFRGDLENFYKQGFRPVTMTQYLTNKMPIPPGSTPVIITMDDSAPTQLKLNNKGEVDPNCAVGIWSDFAAVHPDFPVKGTFYVLPVVMWDQEQWVHTKVRLLKSLGSELACHTWDHPSLRQLSDASVERELGRSMDYLASLGFDSPSLAFPYGIYPRHLPLLKDFAWHGKRYHVTGSVTCNPELSPSPEKIGGQLYTLPRIEARRGFLALDYWIPKLAKGKSNLYVTP